MPELTYFNVGLGDEDVAWLLDLARVTGVPPRRLIAQLIRDIRVDDLTAHESADPISLNLHEDNTQPPGEKENGTKEKGLRPGS